MHSFQNKPKTNHCLDCFKTLRQFQAVSSKTLFHSWIHGVSPVSDPPKQKHHPSCCWEFSPPQQVHLFLGMMWPLPKLIRSWWKKSGGYPVEVGSWNPIIYRVFIHPRWLAGFLNHQQYEPQRLIEKHGEMDGSWRLDVFFSFPMASKLWFDSDGLPAGGTITYPTYGRGISSGPSYV